MQSFWSRYFALIMPLILLALPLLGAYLALNGMTVVDTIMAGRLSSTDLAAIAVGSSVFIPLILLTFGILMATTPLVAQAVGSGRIEKLSSIVNQATWVAVLILLPAGLSLFYSRIIFDFMGINDEIANLATNYLRALIWGLPALFFFQVLRCTCEGLHHVIPVLLISLAGLLLNIPANYILIYGKLGLPQLGAVGCGYATAISFWFMAVLLGFYINYYSHSRGFAIFAAWQLPKWPEIGHILWIGVPVGLSLFIEVSLFNVITLFIGGLGEIIVAGHQVAINFTGFIFMVPLSLSMALTIKVAYAVGAGQAEQARQIAFYGISFALGISIITASFMWFAAANIASVYSENIEIKLLATSLIQLAAFYQISDAIQVNSAAALRAYKDTRIIILITIFSYWFIGLGGGWWLANGFGPMAGHGVYGFWYGIILGLSVAAMLLLWRLHNTSKLKLEIIPQHPKIQAW
jgi:multidrug resistance protein, MATE family